MTQVGAVLELLSSTLPGHLASFELNGWHACSGIRTGGVHPWHKHGGMHVLQ
jgi:hypothetical protein